MGSKMSLFQTVVLIIFGIFGILGLIFFATYSAGGKKNAIGRVIMWGTLDQRRVDATIEALNAKSADKYKSVFYAQIPEYEFDAKVVDALASGEGPDIIILTQADIERYDNKIQPISYELISERAFKDIFIDGAELFLSSKGARALPLLIDPLVMYWNRDIFADNAVVSPPAFWKEFPALSAQMTTRDNANNILNATVAFGAHENVRYAKDILFMLMMQAGAEVLSYDYKNDELVSSVLERKNMEQAEKALRFYTAFANPVSNSYSWNRSMPDSLDLFTRDRLAVYFGYSSDLPLILAKNPHLNFDVSLVPQLDAKEKKKKNRNYGRFYAFAISKTSKNKKGAFTFLSDLAQSENLSLLSEKLGLMPGRRELLSKYDPNDALDEIFRKSAVMARAFLEPDPKKVDAFVAEMINSVISGQASETAALSRFGRQIEALLNKDGR